MNTEQLAINDEKLALSILFYTLTEGPTTLDKDGAQLCKASIT